MNICSYKKVNPMDERGVNDRFGLLFKEVCYLKANSGSGGSTQVLTDSATIVWDYSLGNIASVTLGGDRTLSVVNPRANTTGLLYVKQDSTGSRLLTITGNKPVGWALSAAANSVDLIGFFYNGTEFYWSKENYPATSGAAISFPTITDITENPSGIWKTPSTNSGYGHMGLSNKYLPANTSGRIYFTGTSNHSVLGFNTTNTNQSWTNYEAGIIIASGDLYSINSGTLGTVVEAQNIAMYYCVYRDGSTGAVKIQKSSDTFTWTDLRTLVFNSTAALYIGCDLYGAADAILVNPKSVGTI